MLIHLHNVDDPRLAPYRHLKESQAARRAGLFIAEGDKLSRRLLASGIRLHSLLLGQNHLARFRPLAPAEVPVYVVPERLIESIVGFNFHRGVLACAFRPADQGLDSLLVQLATPEPSARRAVVVCPDVCDPENLGSILRTAGALGIDGAVLGPGCADPYSRRVLRVSMGTVFKLPLARVAQVAGALDALAAAGYQRWAAVTDADAEPLPRLQQPPRVAVVLGSEGHGLDAACLAHCDRRVTVPMRPGIDSLNVAVAAGIFLYGLTHKPT